MLNLPTLSELLAPTDKAEIAAKCGFSRSLVHRLCHGQPLHDDRFIAPLADALALDLATMFLVVDVDARSPIAHVQQPKVNPASTSAKSEPDSTQSAGRGEVPRAIPEVPIAGELLAPSGRGYSDGNESGRDVLIGFIIRQIAECARLGDARSQRILASADLRLG